MSAPRRLVMRLLSFLRAGRAERELDREMTAHLRQLEDDFIRKGLPPGEARLAARLEQVADDPFPLNQGTLYAALTRLEQKGWIKGTWQRTESNREAKYYAITRAGSRALERQTARWRRLVGFVDALLLDEG